MLISDAGHWQSCAASAVSASKASSGPEPTTSYSHRAATRAASLSTTAGPPRSGSATGYGACVDGVARTDIEEPSARTRDTTRVGQVRQHAKHQLGFVDLAILLLAPADGKSIAHGRLERHWLGGLVAEWALRRSHGRLSER